MNEDRDTKLESLASSLKLDAGTSEATEQDPVVGSGSTDQLVVNKKWFKNLKEIDATLTNKQW